MTHLLIIFFSAYDNSKKIERIQLGQSYFGITKLYLSIEDYKDKVIYFDLECSSDSNCSGEENYTFLESIELIQGEPINYYINNEIETIYFSIRLENKFANIWARGQYNITAELSSDYDKKRNIGDSGVIYIINNNEKEKVLTFKVTAKKGDYINVGYIEFDEKNTSISELKNEGPIITGYLNKKVLNEVCYKIETNGKNLFGKGIILTKYVETYLKKDNKKINSKSVEIYISHNLNESFSHACLTFPEDSDDSKYNNIDEIVFTYEIGNPHKKFSINKEPQLNGIFNPGAISEDSKVAYISHKNGFFDIMSFKLSSFSGFPKMNVAYCSNYPLCLEDIENAFTITNINRFSFYDVEYRKYFDNSPISKNQTLFIVDCKRGQNIGSEENNSDKLRTFCEYNTLIYTNKDAIELQENNFFNQYVQANQEHEYRIKLTDEMNIYIVLIDILIYIGEVEINTEKIEKLGLKPNQYDEVNKIFVSMKIEIKPYKDLYFSVKGLKNAYYTILTSFVKNEQETKIIITNKLQSGIPYLVTLKTGKNDQEEKIIEFKNERVFDRMPFMVNFYSLNCKIDVLSILDEKTQKIDQFEQFSQEIIDSTDEKYKYPLYKYKIKVIEPDISSFNNNLCKVYASSIEMNKEFDDVTRDILLPDNTPQQIMFGKESNHITFGYTLIEFSNDLLIKFNLIHTAKYKVQFYFENKKRKIYKEAETIIVSNNLINLKSKEWHNNEICSDDKTICYIQIDITLLETKYNNKPILEISVTSMSSNIVSYIPKNRLKVDYVQTNKPQFYYTEIGEYEKGFISLNFLRGSGKVYSKVIKKNIEQPEKNADWKGKYKLPYMEKEKEMIMDPFTKKTEIIYDDNCKEGCYLLLKVFSDVKKDETIDSYINYPFSIFINSCPIASYDKNPPIRISIDQYIVGAVQSNKVITPEYYSVWLKYDADLVIIDFQTNAAIMYINVKEDKQTKNPHFKFFPSGKDTIYSIKKEEILKYYDEKEKINGLKDKILTIAIWANITDSLYTTPFSFAIRLTDNDSLIYRVNSHQKVLCNSSKFEDNDSKKTYRCLFVINYDNMAQFSALYIYASSQDKSASLGIFASIINSTDYEMNSIDKINFPNYQNSEYSLGEQLKDYLIIDYSIKINQYVLVSVEVDMSTTIELISTIFLDIKEITPNSFSYQLFNVYDEVSFNFPNKYMELVNIICLGGSGEIYWDNDKNNTYYLNGRDDRLTITSSKSNKEHKLKMKSHLQGINFVGIIKYNIRNNELDFDSLNLDKSVNFVYSESDFPIALYCPLNILNNEEGDYYDVVFSFLNLDFPLENRLKGYETFPFDILGFIVKESAIIDLKSDPGTTPRKNEYTIPGIYDNAIRTGLIRINREKLKVSDEKLFLYIKIDKTDLFRDKIYDIISFESTVFHKNAMISVSEVSNQFGFLDENQDEIIYVLRNDRSKNYMNIEFSSEQDNIDAYIENLGFASESTRKYGKIYYFLPTNNVDSSEEYVNLYIRRNHEKGNEKQYFFFRYSFSENTSNRKYDIANTNLEVIQTKINKKATYTITLTPVTNQSCYDLTYIIRLKNDKKIPKISNIAMNPENQEVYEFYNPTPKNDKLILEINNASSEVNYIQVIAQIKEEEMVDFLSYDLKIMNTTKSPNDENYEDDDSSDSDNTAIILLIIGSVLVVLAVILIFLIMKCKKKNKDLLEKVNKVSFSVERNNNANEDLLLNK